MTHPAIEASRAFTENARALCTDIDGKPWEGVTPEEVFREALAITITAIENAPHEDSCDWDSQPIFECRCLKLDLDKAKKAADALLDGLMEGGK